MEEIILMLIQWANDSGFGLYVGAVCLACALFVALAPVTVTEKVPDWLMRAINVLAVNWGNAANKKSNLSGNPE